MKIENNGQHYIFDLLVGKAAYYEYRWKTNRHNE